MATGEYDRHIRRMQKRYRERRHALLGALKHHLGADAQVEGSAAGTARRGVAAGAAARSCGGAGRVRAPPAALASTRSPVTPWRRCRAPACCSAMA